MTPTGSTGVEPVRDEPAAGWDDRSAAGTNGEWVGMNFRVCRAYLVLGGLIVAGVLVGALSMAHDAARGGHAYDLDWPLFWESTSGIATLVLLPLIRLGVRQVQDGWNRLRGAAAIVGLMVGFPVLHVLGMVVLRKLGCAAIGVPYDFHWETEFPYELRKDLVSIAWMGAAFWVVDRPAPAPRLALPASPPSTLWLRDGTTDLRVDPHDVVWIASAGNYVEFALTNGKRHLIRGTLAGQMERLTPIGFARVHRTRLVNVARVTTLTARASGDFDIGLDTGEVVSGSRRYRDAVVLAPFGPTSGQFGAAPLSSPQP